MDILIIAILAAILGGAGYAIHRSKKAGKKCIGCPDSGCCGGCGGCGR
ncbi:MAG: FeoB-associated Cys-rich membrane protein [Ruminococcaceae bacterium]|nr:FeoB-associated Cys-rich membrane protein [Oscillospiraceae bacterium]